MQCHYLSSRLRQLSKSLSPFHLAPIVIWALVKWANNARLRYRLYVLFFLFWRQLEEELLTKSRVSVAASTTNNNAPYKSWSNFDAGVPPHRIVIGFQYRAFLPNIDVRTTDQCLYDNGRQMKTPLAAIIIKDGGRSLGRVGRGREGGVGDH